MDNMVNIDSDNIRDFVLINGESRNVRSPYYQKLIQYTRSLIKALNGKNVTIDLESYCYRQLYLTREEMKKYREAFIQTIRMEPPTDGPSAS
jgi:hypothetical protein